MNFPTPIYLFHPSRRPVVSYDSIGSIHYRWTGKYGEGLTYGEALRAARLESKSAAGLVCLEHDIAVPLEAWEQLATYVLSWRREVCAVNYRLYPASTGRTHTVWAHRYRNKDGELKFVPASMAPPLYPDAFSLGCTYLPGALLDAMPDDLRQWDYPRLDTLLSDLARERQIRCRAVDLEAVHMHY